MQNLIPGFVTLTVVIIVARITGMLLKKLGQPAVVGEILGGILLGPSVLGCFFPGVSQAFFHPEALSFLKNIAEVGILLYLFIIGLEIDLHRLQKSARAAVIVSQSSLILPLVLGVFLARQIYTDYAPAGVGYFEFSLFIAIALSITAFPVLARLLAESSFHRTALGDLALTCAAIDDLSAWCLVAVLSGLMRASGTPAYQVMILSLIFIFAMLFVLKPLFIKWINALDTRSAKAAGSVPGFLLVGALAAAGITEWIGIHGFFGAFLFGAIIPCESLPARQMSGRLKDFIAILFLPAFFAITGLKTEVGLVSSIPDVVICVVIVGLAILGKFGGAFGGALWAGLSRYEATVLGILMNTRGMVELIVLNIGLSLGVLSPKLFTMFVIMALTTTLMTGPLLKIFSREIRAES